MPARVHGNILVSEDQQTFTVSGVVTSDLGEPIVGASVVADATGASAVTNESGAFTIKVPAQSLLTVSFVGYAEVQQLITKDELNLSIVLTASETTLEEVVVTALGIKKEKKALAYSVGEIKGKDLTEARSPNIANQLAGKVAGLNVTTPATGANGASRIVIRGNGSISGNNQPLIVVDGIPINNDNTLFGPQVGIANGNWAGNDRGDGISSLNPDEIESVSVLKGATAAALYGSRASNGAILITTKGAKAGQKDMGVEVNVNTVVEDLLINKFNYQYEYGSGTGGEKPLTVAQAKTGRFSWGGRLDGSDAMFYDGVMRPYVAQKNNLKDFYETGISTTSSVGISGASDKTRYRFSFSNLDYNGIQPSNTLNRNNFAINLSSDLSDKLSILVNAKYVTEKNHNRPRVNDSPGNANFAITALPTSLGVGVLRDNKYDANGYELAWSDNVYTQNPYFAAEDFKQDDRKNRVIGAIEPKLQITDWLYAKARFGMDYFNYKNLMIEPYGTAYELRGAYIFSQRNFREYNTDVMIGLNKDLNENWSVSGLIGANNMKQVTEALDINAYNSFNIPFFYDVSNIDPSARNTFESYIQKKISSVYGSAEVSYKGYLYLNATARNDWFSTLSQENNSILYPAVGASFVASEAFTLPQSINYLKFRGSWAQAGGDTDPYNLSLRYALNGSNLGAPLGWISGNNVPNAKLKPLTSTTFEFGFETRMFDSRFNVDFTYYNRKTTNDIVAATISSTSGFNTALFNVGEISNKGVEVLVGGTPIKTDNFSWETSVNMGYNLSEVVSLYGDADRLRVDQGRYGTAFVDHIVGQPYGQITGFDYKRDDAGNIVHDANGAPMQGNLKDFGTGVSPYTVGFSNTFTYKKLSLSTLIDGKFGGVMYSGTESYAYRFGLSPETLVGREGGIVGEGVNQAGEPNTVNTTAQAYWGNLFNKVATPHIYKSDFIKLRQVILSYTFDSFNVKSYPVKLSVGIVGRNLAILKKYTPNIDPESSYNNGNAQGLEYAGTPATRTVGVNLNIKF
ncbi:TonB-dependent receptor [Flavobacterium akiainvivens]|uniref:TonB-dependent receptor n=2 Tax=Flavobacterium akiainvivens TaxID=1202724 RepID=A0A0M8MG79_9FLAO|nr:TonB-dependent receptor [Flavobacterium akiainvivens]